MQERVISLAHGIDVAVLEAGAGGRPLLLVHGFTGAKEDFADHLGDFAELGWWVLAPDLRGHGSSTKPEAEHEYTLDTFAADLAALVDAMAWSRFVLLGHSMGGMIAQVLAASHHERLDGLVLMDTSHGPIDSIDRDTVALGAAIVRDGGMEAVKAALDALGDDAPLSSPAYERLIAERPEHKEFGDAKFLNSAPAMYAAMLGQLLDQPDRLSSLGDLDVPALVIVGDQDESFLAPSARMAATLPRSTHAVISEAGHSPQFENPDGWRDAMLAFLAQL